jgi:hypothetical protein
MLCRHCHTGPVCRPRGLCWSCYYTPGVREQHPSMSKFAYRSPGSFFMHSTPAEIPTQALPGSPEKVAVLMERASHGQELWHPQDATMEEARIRLGQVG